MAGAWTTKSFDKQLAALQRGLSQFRQSTQNKLVRRGVAAGMRVVVKSIKGEIPPGFKGAKQAIGGRMMKRVAGSLITTAKVGAAVGKKTPKKSAAMRSKGRGKRPGVGIGPENIHWFIMGADGSSKRGGGPPRRRQWIRITGQRTFRQSKTKGFSTGVMPPQFPDAVKMGVIGSLHASYSKMAEIIRKGISLEAAKLAAKVNAARK